jgi:hypothetical protein
MGGRSQAAPAIRPGRSVTVTLNLSPEAIEAIARRAAELVAEEARPTDDGWLRGADKIASYIDCKPDRVMRCRARDESPSSTTGRP